MYATQETGVLLSFSGCTYILHNTHSLYIYIYLSLSLSDLLYSLTHTSTSVPIFFFSFCYSTKTNQPQLLGQRTMSKLAGPLNVLVRRDGVEIGGRERRRGEGVAVNAGHMRNKLYPSGDAVYDTPLNRALLAREAAIRDRADSAGRAREEAADAESAALAQALSSLAEKTAPHGISVVLPKGRSSANKFSVAAAVLDALSLDSNLNPDALVDTLSLPKESLPPGPHTIHVPRSDTTLNITIKSQ